MDPIARNQAGASMALEAGTIQAIGPTRTEGLKRTGAGMTIMPAEACFAGSTCVQRAKPWVQVSESATDV